MYRDDNRDDAAYRNRPREAERSSERVSAVVWGERQGADHGARTDDALLGARAGSGSDAAVAGARHGAEDDYGCEAGGGAWHAIRLQRYQLRNAWISC